MKYLIVNGKRCIEWFPGEPRPIHVSPGLSSYYRDGNGDVRLNKRLGENCVVSDVEARE